jgi:hypothetical protein
MQFPGIKNEHERADLCAFLGECQESDFTQAERTALKLIRFGRAMEQMPDPRVKEKLATRMERQQHGGLLDALSMLTSVDVRALSDSIEAFCNPVPPTPVPTDHAEANPDR